MKAPSDTPCPPHFADDTPSLNTQLPPARIRERERWLDPGREAEEPHMAALPTGSLPSRCHPVRCSERGNLEDGAGDRVAD